MKTEWRRATTLWATDKVLLIVDNFVESRSNNDPPELNLLLGIREPAEPGK